MTDVAPQQALVLWGLGDARVDLVARRENTIWRVTSGALSYALRFHRPGYRNMAELRSEMQWMDHLARGGLSVPAPFAMPDGQLIGQVGAYHVSLLTWLEGRPLGAQNALHHVTDPVAMCRQLGRDMARLHDLSDRWAVPAGFSRPDWRRAGLLGDDPLWGRFWEHPGLNAGQRALLERARMVANDHLARIEAAADQGLIHADLLTENILIHNNELSFIDFDDGATGFRDFELATFLLKFTGQPGFGDMRAALCEGYSRRRKVHATDLDLFLLLRALTYPGWIMARMDEPGAETRSARALSAALNMTEIYLKRRET